MIRTIMKAEVVAVKRRWRAVMELLEVPPASCLRAGQVRTVSGYDRDTDNVRSNYDRFSVASIQTNNVVIIHKESQTLLVGNKIRLVIF